jgi:GNAT superfamily N-acetyltransferase
MDWAFEFRQLSWAQVVQHQATEISGIEKILRCLGQKDLPACSNFADLKGPECARCAAIADATASFAREKTAKKASPCVSISRPACCSSAHLAFAATLPESRGAGVGVALTDASFAWAAGRGYRAIVTDWRVTNLLASRFWPRRGFRPSVLRLYRSIP